MLGAPVQHPSGVQPNRVPEHVPRHAGRGGPPDELVDAVQLVVVGLGVASQADTTASASGSASGPVPSGSAAAGAGTMALIEEAGGKNSSSARWALLMSQPDRALYQASSSHGDGLAHGIADLSVFVRSQGPSSPARSVTPTSEARWASSQSGRRRSSKCSSVRS